MNVCVMFCSMYCLVFGLRLMGGKEGGIVVILVDCWLVWFDVG